MATWTAATNAVRAKVEATLGDGGTLGLVPGYDEIPDGADIDGHADLFLRKGYSVNILESGNVVTTTCAESIEERNYTVILSREVPIVRTNTEGFVSIKNEMLDHSEELRKALCRDQTLGGTIIDITWIGDGGIDEITDPSPENPGPRYYILGVEFTVQIRFTVN